MVKINYLFTRKEVAVSEPGPVTKAALKERVWIEDALKHLHECEYAESVPTAESLAGALAIPLEQSAPLLSKLKAREMTDGQKAELCKWQSDHRWCPNQLRHTAATEIRREFGLEAAQIMLGHAQASVTQLYAQRDLTKGLDVASQIG